MFLPPPTYLDIPVNANNYSNAETGACGLHRWMTYKGVYYPKTYAYKGTQDEMFEEVETGEYDNERWIDLYDLYDRIGLESGHVAARRGKDDAVAYFQQIHRKL